MPLRSQVLEILIPKDQNLPLRCVQGELIKSFFRQLGNLHSFDLSAKVRANVLGGGVGVEQIGLCGVSARARVYMIYEIFE